MTRKLLGRYFCPIVRKVKKRKDLEDRKSFNNWVWSKVLHMDIVNRKLKNKGFTFHHEINTDGVAVSLLYSKLEQGYPVKKCKKMKVQEEKLV